MKLTISTSIGLIVLLALQYSIWRSERGFPAYLKIRANIEALQKANEQLKLRNNLVLAEIEDLKGGLDAIEERARNELGMIKEGEVFYRIIEKPPHDSSFE